MWIFRFPGDCSESLKTPRIYNHLYIYVFEKKNKKKIVFRSFGSNAYISIIRFLDVGKWGDAEHTDYLSDITAFLLLAKCRVIKGRIVVTKVLDWLVYATVMPGQNSRSEMREKDRVPPDDLREIARVSKNSIIKEQMS